MHYCSTRGGVRGWDFRDVLFSGYAPDGGMFMPETVPPLSSDTLRGWRGLPYTKLVVEVASLFIPTQQIPREDLEGTSGDTGGSAIQSAKGLSGLDVLVVYPRGRVTPVQEKHMITCLKDNIHVFAADGSSDDIDQPLRRLFADPELVRSHGLMSLNSVNWSRVMIQLAHFIYAYLELSGMEQMEADGDLPELEVVVPTGGAGNIAAGYIVKQMGVPLKLVAMVNSNDIVHRTVTTGDFSMAADVTQTLAPAIDIQDPYNMERVFWLLLDRDGASVKNMMEEFQQSHRLSLPENHRRLLSQVLSTGTVTDEGILETMRRCWEENQYVLCPHTAVAVWHHYHCPHSPTLNRCYVATASPAKFKAAVEKAGLTFDLPETVLALDKLATRYENLERNPNWCKDWEDRLREKIQSVSSVRKNRGTYYI
uniref:threonine synthase-like 2 isoform X2 n=1 Tax=Scatophagus argus TaxID=75038 RepID=UPI001ED8327D|nr:threonine synthase-like 2 isoform X2 [Scatophagus argus]